MRLIPAILVFIFVFSLAARAQSGAPRFDIGAVVEGLTQPSSSKKEALENFRALLSTSIFPRLPTPKNLFNKLGQNPEPNPFWDKISVMKIIETGGSLRINELKINPASLSALWALVPELAFQNTRGVLTHESCERVAPLLAVMTAIGVQLKPQSYALWNFSKKDFAAWLELYLTLGNRLEMQGGQDLLQSLNSGEEFRGHCDAATAYMQSMLSDLSGLPWTPRIFAGQNWSAIRGSSTEEQVMVVSAPGAPGYHAEFRFWRQFGPNYSLAKARFKRFVK
jgi:hypothetical protein